MTKFKVYASEIVCHFVEVEAETEAEAYQKANMNIVDWQRLGRLDWNIEEVERDNNA